MSRCIWKSEKLPNGNYQLSCVRCKQPAVESPSPPEKSHRVCFNARPVLAVMDCRYRGLELREEVCPTCTGHDRIKVFACSVEQECTVKKPIGSIAVCERCSKYEPPMKWSYGVTTVPSRLNNLLSATLTSLDKAGFGKPRLFVDGDCSGVPIQALGLSVTVRGEPVRAYANWVLAAWELYLREPTADRYAIFQDDIIVYKNLREYLERTPYPERGYCNLFTYPYNVQPNKKGWYPTYNQQGKGALALVFDNAAMSTLLSQPNMVAHPRDVNHPNARRQGRSQCCIDGAVVDSMKAISPPYLEYVHNPSLVEHTGKVSAIREYNKRHKDNSAAEADTFRGEQFDALELLKPCESV